MKFILVFIFVIFSLPTFAEVGSCSGSWVEFPESIICQDLTTDNHAYIEALKRGCTSPGSWTDQLCPSDINGRCKFVAANATVNVTYKNIPADILAEERAGCATDGGVWEDTYFRK
jgi:hypothetical protein